jgi:hypothetical protein
MLAIVAAAAACGCWHNCSDASCTDEFDIVLGLSGNAISTANSLGVDVDIGYGWSHFDCDLIGHCKPSGSSPTLTVDAWRAENAGSVISIEAVQQGRPVSLTVRVTQAGGELAQHTFSPQYATIQPNGPDCDPTCHVARDSATVNL